MKVLLTGGSGNLGQTLVPKLLDRGDMPVILDVRAPRVLKTGALFIEGSILDRPKLGEIFRGCDCIVHIAAWHGIDKIIFISTTSVYRPDTLYGRSKVLAELIAEDYRKNRYMNVVTLRPRGFYSPLGPRRVRPLPRLGALVLEGSGSHR
jgi:nucleoside-diphosphate-sugar epimerase